MKIIIHPTYRHLRSFIENIPLRFDSEGELVYTARNQLKKFNVEGITVIVKRYKRPHYVNRIAYSFIRPPKAERAYSYAIRLNEMHVHSPEPIAYIIDNKGGLIEKSYFISVFKDQYQDIRELMLGNLVNDFLLRELAVFIADFHARGVLHMDMSPGNILYSLTPKKVSFTLIDINRMQFLNNLTATKRYQSFKRMTNNRSVLQKLSVFYAEAAGLPVDETVKEIIRFSDEFFNSRKMKRRK